MAVATSVVSMLVFFGHRFRSLRAEVESGRFSTDEFRKDPRSYIRGPIWTFRIWMACTIALIFAIIIYSALVVKVV